jgi:hypothetical protein
MLLDLALPAVLTCITGGGDPSHQKTKRAAAGLA